jgi:thiosulfate dehydrogenase
LENPWEPTPIEALEPHLREAVLRGKRLMEDPSLGTRGLSCASCHPNPKLNREWASEFPRRWSTTRRPEPRILTLAQHNVGAVVDVMGGRPLSPDDPLMIDLEAYIVWLGEGTLVWSTETPGRKQLEEKVAEGREEFQRSCQRCHSEGDLKGVSARFPRYVPEAGRVLNLEGFLRHHERERLGEVLLPGSEASTALVTYLTSLSRGYPIDLPEGEETEAPP